MVDLRLPSCFAWIIALNIRTLALTVVYCFRRRKLCRVLGIIANNTTELSEDTNVSEVGMISELQLIYSSSLACPIIWGRRYSWWCYSSVLPCLLRCPLSTPPLSYLSYVHLSILGLASLLFFPLVCPHLPFFSLCDTLSSSSHGRNNCVIFLLLSWTLAPLVLFHLCIHISDLIPPCPSQHPSQHPHLIYF